MNNVKQIGLAAINFHSTHRSFPLGMEMHRELVLTRATFFVRLLPYLEENALADRWVYPDPNWAGGRPENAFENQDVNVTADASTSRAATIMPALVCPSDRFEQNPFELTGTPGAFGGSTSHGGFPGWYSGTSYAGNYGEGSFYVQNSQFAIRPNGALFVSGPSPSLAAGGTPGSGLHALAENHQNVSPASASRITDGTSQTLMIGEKYHEDLDFDMWTANNSGFKMHQVSTWAWSGGMKGAGTIFCSSAVEMNQGVKYWSATPSFLGQDSRFNSWGSGHVGGVNFVFCDGSATFLTDGISQVTLAHLSTRAGDDIVSGYE